MYSIYHNVLSLVLIVHKKIEQSSFSELVLIVNVMGEEKETLLLVDIYLYFLNSKIKTKHSLNMTRD